MVLDMKVNLLKHRKITKRYDQHHRMPAHDEIIRHHPPIPVPSRVESLQATHHMHYLETTSDSKAEYINTQQVFVRNRMPVSLRGGGGELGNLKP
jgi:hypothetical protein